MTNAVIADYWEQSKESKGAKTVKCLLCPNYCVISESCSGKCSVRKNTDGKLIATAYGKVSSIALDPIEKKPLYDFCSGTGILSIGSIGCNFHCPFCQNYSISMEYGDIETEKITPEQIVDAAKRYVPDGNIGIAYTYNEPLINYEFIRDCALMTAKEGLKNVLVTNGYICQKPLLELLPYIDAMNIDLKGNENTYKTVGGTLEDVKKTIKIAAGSCHVEVTTLIIPELTEEDIRDASIWLAGIDKNIPYHLSGFFPRYKYINYEPTPVEKMYKFKETASEYLNKVYLGNI